MSLTPTGEDLVEEIDPAAQAAQREVLGVLSAREQDQLAKLLRRVLEAHDRERGSASA